MITRKGYYTLTDENGEPVGNRHIDEWEALQEAQDLAEQLGPITIHCPDRLVEAAPEEPSTNPAEPPVEEPPVTEPPPAGDPADYTTASVTWLNDDGTEAFSVAVGYGFHPFKLGEAHGFIFHSKDGSINIYNGYMDTKAAMVGTVIIKAPDGTELANENITLGIGMGTQPCWYKQPVPKKPDAAMLALLPNYADGVPNDWVKYAAGKNYSLTGLGISSTDDQIASGERPDIGLLPAWNVPYLLDPSPANADVVRKSGNSAAVWPVHFFDPATNKPVSIKDYPGASTNWYYFDHNWQGNVNPIQHGGTGPYKVGNSAHLPAFGILETLVYGTEYDKLELASWANYCQICMNPGYRNGAAGSGLLTSGQTRGKAWQFRQIAAAAKLLDDEYFTQQVVASIAEAERVYLQRDDCVDLFWHSYAPSPDRIGYAPWEHDFLMQALQFGQRLGFDCTALGQHFGRLNVERVLSRCYQWASLYALKAMPQKGAAPYKNWGEMIDATIADAVHSLGDLSAECGNHYHGWNGYQPDDFYGYPDATTGYPAMMKGGLAAAVDFGCPNADEAWQVFLQHERINWQSNWKYNIVPAVDNA